MSNSPLKKLNSTLIGNKIGIETDGKIISFIRFVNETVLLADNEDGLEKAQEEAARCF